MAPSANLDTAVEAVANGAFGGTGQACTACSRAIAHTDVHDEFLDRIVAHAESIEVGPGLEDYEMGLHVSESELESTLGYIEVESIDEAVRIANDVDCRLSGGIITEDHSEANRFVREIEAGVARSTKRQPGLNCTCRSAATSSPRVRPGASRATPVWHSTRS